MSGLVLLETERLSSAEMELCSSRLALLCMGWPPVRGINYIDSGPIRAWPCRVAYLVYLNT